MEAPHCSSSTSLRSQQQTTSQGESWIPVTPHVDLSQREYTFSFHQLKVTQLHREFILLYRKPRYRQWRKGSGIWGRRNLKSWFSLLKKKKKGKNKKVIINTPGRKLRRRELKVCRFSIEAFQEEKQTQPQTPDRTITWEAAISSSSSSCSASSMGIWHLKLTSACWENTFNGIHTAV